MQHLLKKKVMVVCPSSVDRRELSWLNLPHYEIIYHQYDPHTFWQLLYDQKDGQPLHLDQLVDQIKQDAREYQVDGIFSAKDYPGSLLASIVADQLGLCGTPPKALLNCQHKYLSRLKQKEVVPEAVPGFCLLSSDNAWKERISFPCFLKPIKAMLSFGALKVHSLTHIANALPQVPEAFTDPLHSALRNYNELTPDGNFIAEEILKGQQVTLDGFMFQGECTTQGIVDSLMYPNALSFKRFTYPSRLPKPMQKLVADISQKVMKHIGYDNGMFNIEFMCDLQNQTAHIIEINTRMASQYADLYEKVDGTNSYEIALSIASGTRPRVKFKKGKFKIAASFVMRVFKNAKVISTPLKSNLKRIYHKYPDIRINIIPQPGKYLSDYLQDGQSFRYCLIHIGAQSKKELMQKYQECKKKLHFDFEYC